MITLLLANILSFIAGFLFCRWLYARNIISDRSEHTIKINVDSSQALKDLDHMQKKVSEVSEQFNKLKKAE